MHRIDKVFFGVLIGLLVPFLALMTIYIYTDVDLDWSSKESLVLNLKVMSPYLRLSLIANMLFFIPFSNKSRNRFLRGLIGAMFIYGLIIIIIHFL